MGLGYIDYTAEPHIFHCNGGIPCPCTGIAVYEDIGAFINTGVLEGLLCYIGGGNMNGLGVVPEVPLHSGPDINHGCPAGNEGFRVVNGYAEAMPIVILVPDVGAKGEYTTAYNHECLVYHLYSGGERVLYS